MTAHELRTTVRHVLVEADDLYTMMIEAGESPNLDSLGYTSQIRLQEFRDLLDRPELDVEELAELLRSARQRVREVLGPREYTRIPQPAVRPSRLDWSDLMAGIVVNRANQNAGQDMSLSANDARALSA